MAKNTKMGKASSKINMRLTLILFAAIPMICITIILCLVLIKESKSELAGSTNNSLVSIITQTGNSFDYATDNARVTMQAFAQAPIVREALANPDDADIAAKAQKYTVDYFGKLEGYEGLYIADWGTKVLTHPSDAMIGKVLREGDSLAGLQQSMVDAGDFYNTGVMTSPASGQLIMSFYAPIYDGSTPIGYIGAATYVNEIASKFSDVSSLGLSSAYIYFVDRQGTMLYHPDESKIGNPVENAAVKGLVEKLAAGEHPSPECVHYEYKGAQKYAAYYVGEGENYIAVLTADETDVLGGINSVRTITIIIAVVVLIIFIALSLLIAQKVAKPLTQIADATERLSTGDISVECNAVSNIKETVSVINAFQALKGALDNSMRSVKDSAFILNKAILSVDDMTGNNVESISQINSAIDEVATTSQSVAENAQIMQEKAMELGDNIEVLNGNVINLYDASQTIKNANNEATACMKYVYSGANESVDAMKHINEKIAETNEAIEAIGKAVESIESIAAQTNLLSLNASIEAARAGEAGRGFAVVADEIRTLADSSALSAKEIKQVMEEVVNLSNGTVEISGRVFDVISKEQSDIAEAQEKFNILSDSVETSISEINTIKEMTGKLNTIKEELSATTNELGAISEELGASAQEVAASCQTVTSACADTQESTSEMRSANQDMSSAIEFFKL